MTWGAAFEIWLNRFAYSRSQRDHVSTVLADSTCSESILWFAHGRCFGNHTLLASAVSLLIGPDQIDQNLSRKYCTDCKIGIEFDPSDRSIRHVFLYLIIALHFASTNANDLPLQQHRALSRGKRWRPRLRRPRSRPRWVWTKRAPSLADRVLAGPASITFTCEAARSIRFSGIFSAIAPWTPRDTSSPVPPTLHAQSAPEHNDFYLNFEFYILSLIWLLYELKSWPLVNTVRFGRLMLSFRLSTFNVRANAWRYYYIKRRLLWVYYNYIHFYQVFSFFVRYAI